MEAERKMKILAIPRDHNPYQEQLYDQLRALGQAVTYLEGPTGSQTVNLLLMPLSLIRARLRGYQVLHIHWTFVFVPAWVAGSLAGRTACRYWFSVLLFLSQRFGFRIVWTAHNVLPHKPIFDDDLAARRSLVRRCDAVVAMNPAVAKEVFQRFSPKCDISIIPHGNYDGVYGPLPSKGEARESLQIPGRAFVVLFFGRIETYKGVPDLLRSCEHLPSDVNFLIIVAGLCRDATLRAEVEILAAASRHRVMLRLEEISSNEVAPLLRAASVVVFPFRSVSTTGSLILAMGMGAVCIVPNLPTFSDVPQDAVLRYQPGDLTALERALRTAMEVGDCMLSGVSNRARTYTATLSWDNIARQHNELFSRAARGVRW